MASFEFRLPDIGEGVTEGEIVEWHVTTGDAVEEDEPMVEVMTDKATVTIGAPRDGTVEKLCYTVGATAAVGSVLVVINTGGSGTMKAITTTAESDDRPVATAVGELREGLPGSNYFNQPNPTKGPRKRTESEPLASEPLSRSATGQASEKPLATPATRKFARDLEVKLSNVVPTGTAGRITKEDVRAHLAAGKPSVLQSATGPDLKRTPISISGDPSLENRKPFVGIRRKIADRMQMAKNTAAHFTFVEECDCERLIDMRSRLKETATDQGVTLSYLPIIVKAVVAALKHHPTLNAALDESTNELVTRNYFHIGIAAATPHGLMVPVIRNADQLSVLDIAREIARLGSGAREGTLKANELTGSTFTITSLGRQGGLFATPILNHPEVGILGVHQMKEKPVVKNGEVVVGNIMLLSLSFDHRIVDGHIGAAFAYDIISYLEDPVRLLLEMT